MDEVWPTLEKEEDGNLTGREAIKILERTFPGTPPIYYAKMFALMDIDKSDSISKQEMTKFMRENRP